MEKIAPKPLFRRNSNESGTPEEPTVKDTPRSFATFFGTLLALEMRLVAGKDSLCSRMTRSLEDSRW